MAIEHTFGQLAVANRVGLRRNLEKVADAKRGVADRDLNPKARKGEEGRLDDEARAHVRPVVQAQENALLKVEMAALRMSPDARRQEAAFDNPARASAVLALLREAPLEMVERFAELAAARSDRVAGWAVLATAVDRDMPREARDRISTTLNVPDDDYSRMLHVATVIKNELTATEMEATFLGFELGLKRRHTHPGASPEEIRAAYDALQLSEYGPQPAAPETPAPGGVFITPPTATADAA